MFAIILRHGEGVGRLFEHDKEEYMRSNIRKARSIKERGWLPDTLKFRTGTGHLSLGTTNNFDFIESSGNILWQIKAEVHKSICSKNAIWWEWIRCTTSICMLKIKTKEVFGQGDCVSWCTNWKKYTYIFMDPGLLTQGEAGTVMTFSLNVLQERAESKGDATLVFTDTGKAALLYEYRRWPHRLLGIGLNDNTVDDWQLSSSSTSVQRSQRTKPLHKTALIMIDDSSKIERKLM